MLSDYAACLENSLPGPSQSAMLGETYTLAPEELESVCVVVNTAEYCNTTLPQVRLGACWATLFGFYKLLRGCDNLWYLPTPDLQLGDLIKRKIDAAFEEHVDMEDVRERFLDVIALALKIVVSRLFERSRYMAQVLERDSCSLTCNRVHAQSHGLACALDSQLARMMKTKWDACAGVGDQSCTLVQAVHARRGRLVPNECSLRSAAYMVEISAAFADLVPKLRRWLSDQYFRTMCEKVGCPTSTRLPKLAFTLVLFAVCAGFRATVPGLHPQVSPGRRTGRAPVAG